MPLRVILFFSACMATALSAQDFPLGIVESGEEVDVELPVPANMSAGAVGEITTDCECLSPLAPNGTARGDKPAGIRFKYRSANPGRVRVTVSVKSAIGDAPAARYTVKGFVYDKSWVVQPKEVRDDPTVTVIDTRWKQQFESVRIPGSSNVPAFAVKTRADLHHRRVVLADGGFTPEDLLTHVQSLRAQGFIDVRYLVGGLPAWLREGGAHEGTAVEPIVSAAAISPIDFARAQVNSAWKSVNLSGDARLSMWPTPDDVERLREVMRESFDSKMMTSLTLVIAEDDSSYAAVERHVGKSAARGLYYLSGGAPALLAFQRMQGALTNRPAELLQTRIAAPRPLMGSGCGTCPQR